MPLGQFVVAGGSITLSHAVTQAVVGLPFMARLQTMQLDLGNEMQTVQGKRKRVAAASIRVRDTADIKVGTTFSTLTPFVPNVSSTDTNEYVNRACDRRYASHNRPFLSMCTGRCACSRTIRCR